VEQIMCYATYEAAREHRLSHEVTKYDITHDFYYNEMKIRFPLHNIGILTTYGEMIFYEKNK